MKSKSILATAALLGVFASSALAVTTVAPAKGDAAKFDAPAPNKVIAPVMLPHQHVGSDITLAMSIDAQGKPSNVRVVGTRDQNAYRHIIATVSKWEFTPARKNGQAVSSKIELPLEVKGL